MLTEADEESILYDSDGGKIHVLNGVGAAIWELCDGNRNLDEITGEICRRYEADEETVKKDLREFIDELEGMGLLV